MLRLLILLIAALSPLLALEKISLQLKWHHQFQFAGYYAAVEKGFYADEGLEVTLKDRDPSKNNIEQVLHGESQYGIADSVLLLYQARKAPIVIVAPIFQHSPNVLITLKKSGIDSPYKLVGKKIAFYPNDADGLPILAMLHETGVLKKQFKRIDTDLDVHALIDGTLDAHHGYITNEPFVLMQHGYETNIINPMHYGVDLYGDMLFTTQEELHRHPERVEAMRKATIRGWKYALSHKEEMIEFIRTKYAPKKSLEQLRYEADGIESVIDPHKTPIGTLDPGRLEYIQNLLRRHGVIDSTVPIADYIYRSAHSGTLDLTPQERQWLRDHPVIRIAVDTAWAPFEYVENGRYQGIAADYVTLIGQKLGVKFEPYTEGVWSDAVHLMEQHRLDMYPCAVKTPQRESYAIFTQPYLHFRMVIVTDNSVGYVEGINDLKNKPVAVARDYYSEEILNRYYPYIQKIRVNTVEEGLKAVETGQAYAFIDNTAAITHAFREGGFSNLKISGELPYYFDLAMGVRNDWPILAEILEKTLASITPKEREAIYNRHVRIEYTQKLSWEWIFKIFTPIAIIIALLLYYTRKLRTINRALKTAVDDLNRTDSELRIANEKLILLSATDSLTGLSNRHRLDEVLKYATDNAKRYNRPLSVIMVDLDYFKTVNDTYGHHTGDKVLQKSATIMREHCRSTDTVGRWGGEEFLIICPETKPEEAIALAEKIRSLFAKEPMFGDYIQTGSFGVCSYNGTDTIEMLIIRVDEALYAAKAAGRNRISLCPNA